MKKAELLAENAIVEKALKDFDLNGSLSNLWGVGHTETRLNNCLAWVYDYKGGKLLRSYNTLIAYIDTDGNCYDFLRKVYGYTATSAKQINKFTRKYNANRLYTWREV